MTQTTELFSPFPLFWKNLEAHCFYYFRCFGRIWNLTVFTIRWLTPLQNSRKKVKTVSFQILPEQWK